MLVSQAVMLPLARIETVVGRAFAIRTPQNCRIIPRKRIGRNELDVRPNDAKLSVPKAMIADDMARRYIGDCASSLAHAACRFAADGLKCGAPQMLYEACPYSTHRNPVVPIFGGILCSH